MFMWTKVGGVFLITPSSLNHSSMTHSLTQGGPNLKQKPLHQLALGIGYCFFGEENEMMFMSRIPSAFSGQLIFEVH